VTMTTDTTGRQAYSFIDFESRKEHQKMMLKSKENKSSHLHLQGTQA